MLQLKVFDKIDDVPCDAWSTGAAQQFYFQHEFLAVMEKSGVEQAVYRYLLFFDNDKIVGAAVLSRFMLHLDLLTGDKTIIFLKRYMPRLLQVSFVCCGIPASFGQNHFHVTDQKYASGAVKLVHRAMEQFAKDTRASLLIWKEFNSEAFAPGPLQREGYIQLPTLPDMVIRLPGGGVDQYLSGLRSDYRRKFKPLAGLVTEGVGQSENSSFIFSALPFEQHNADDFYNGYSMLMERTNVKLETYPKSFFLKLAAAKRVNPMLLRLTNKKNGESIHGLVIKNESTMHFILISKIAASYDDGLYRLFINAIVLYACSEGVTQLHLGQTSYYAKMSAGASPERLTLFLRMRAPFKQLLIRKFGTLLFPELVFRRLRAHRMA